MIYSLTYSINCAVYAHAHGNRIWTNKAKHTHQPTICVSHIQAKLIFRFSWSFQIVFSCLSFSCQNRRREKWHFTFQPSSQISQLLCSSLSSLSEWRGFCHTVCKLQELQTHQQLHISDLNSLFGPGLFWFYIPGTKTSIWLKHRTFQCYTVWNTQRRKCLVSSPNHRVTFNWNIFYIPFKQAQEVSLKRACSCFSTCWENHQFLRIM